MKRLSLFILAMFCIATVSARVICGAERNAEWQKLLHGKRVALLANHTAVVEGEHLLDVMLAKGINVVSVVAPEHGLEVLLMRARRSIRLSTQRQVCQSGRYTLRRHADLPPSKLLNSTP